MFGVFGILLIYVFETRKKVNNLNGTYREYQKCHLLLLPLLLLLCRYFFFLSGIFFLFRRENTSFICYVFNRSTKHTA